MLPRCSLFLFSGSIWQASEVMLCIYQCNGEQKAGFYLICIKFFILYVQKLSPLMQFCSGNQKPHTHSKQVMQLHSHLLYWGLTQACCPRRQHSSTSCGISSYKLKIFHSLPMTQLMFFVFDINLLCIFRRTEQQQYSL